MWIKYLPKYIMQTALLRQFEQGNTPNSNIDLIKNARCGNFDWDKARENYLTWDDVYEKNYSSFCEFHNITLGELETDNPEYLQLIKKYPVTPDAAFTKQNKLLNKNFY